MSTPSMVETTVARISALYTAVGPRLGCTLVEANVLLLLAGLRASTNLLLFEPEAGDAAAITQMNLVGEGLRVVLTEDHERNAATWRRQSVLRLESLAGYAHISTHTQMCGVTPFDPTSGWEGLEIWGKATFDALRANYEPEPVLFDRWIGLVLGYPDRAIADACEVISQGKGFDGFTESNIPAVKRYGGAVPIFSFATEHTDDPGIVATCAAWQELLEDVYASAWHQYLAASPAFQDARRTREFGSWR